MDFRELVDKIYNSETSEDDLYKLLSILVEDYEEQSFQIMWYVIRNSRKIYSSKIVEWCLDYINSNKEKQYYLDFWRLEAILNEDRTSKKIIFEETPIKLTIINDKEQSDLTIKHKMLMFTEIKEHLRFNKLSYDKVKIVRSKNNYDLTNIILFNLGYI